MSGFKKALDEACEEQWRLWREGKLASSPERVLEEAERVRGEVLERVEVVKAKADAVRRRAERMKAGMKGRGVGAPSFRNLSREEARVKAEEIRMRTMRDRSPLSKKVRMRTMERVIPRVGLVCPKCGDTNASNYQVTGKGKRRKKVPWCLKCNVALVKANKVKKFVDIRRGSLDGVRRKLRGLPDG